MQSEKTNPLYSAAAVGISLLTGVILIAPSVVGAITGPPDNSKLPDGVIPPGSSQDSGNDDSGES